MISIELERTDADAQSQKNFVNQFVLIESLFIDVYLAHIIPCLILNWTACFMGLVVVLQHGCIALLILKDAALVIGASTGLLQICGNSLLYILKMVLLLLFLLWLWMSFLVALLAHVPLWIVYL